MKYFSFKRTAIASSVMAASVLALTACGNSSAPAEPETSAADLSAEAASLAAPIEIEGAFIRPPFPGREIAGGFFDITNHGADDRLVSATSPVSDAIEIHTHLMDNGIMKMRRVDGVDLPSGETVSFKPGSYHLMMFATFIPDGAEEVSVTLNFETADSVTLMVPLGEPIGEKDALDGHGMKDGMEMKDGTDMMDGHEMKDEMKMKKEMDHGAEH